VKSIKSFVVYSSIIITLLIFAGIYMSMTLAYDKLAKRSAHETSRLLVDNTFNSLYVGMQRGYTREELHEIIENTRSKDKSNYSINLYRSESVSNIFGAVENNNIHSTVQDVFTHGKEISKSNGFNLTDYVPVTATEECNVCHINTKAGEVLGVVEIKQNLSYIEQNAKRSFVFALLILVPLPLILGIGFSLFISKRINSAMDVFQSEIQLVNSVGDLTKLNITQVDTGFKEFNRIFKDIHIMADKLKSIATDKDILEFEVQLMDKFILTAEAVNDWKGFIKELVIDMNQIAKVESIFALFETEDGFNELDVFWLSAPSDNRKQLTEEYLMHEFRTRRVLTTKGLNQIHHNVSLVDEPAVQEFDVNTLESNTKFLTFPKKRIGNTVGVGIQTSLLTDPSKMIVIDTVMTTMLNVIGSLKAIHSYTKDVEFYATRDPLTNLHNQPMFWDLLRAEFTRAHRYSSSFCLLLIDFDNFKLVNDIYGHAFGDKLLQEYANSLRITKREEDILARYGGDEFTMILPEADEKQAYSVAKRIKDELEKVSLAAPDGKNIKATVSIGIAAYPLHAQEDKQLFLVASNMMYKAKKEGKNRICFPSGSDIVGTLKEVGEKNQLILRAMETKSLVPYFHPLLKLEDKSIQIHELLMRIDKDGEIIPAYQFVDDAETMGVMHKLDLILLEKAFNEIKRANYEGILFVNLSPKSLIIEEFVPEVQALVERFKVDPSKIVFEITERETVRNMSVLQEFIVNLKKEGFKFAIDDFGSGFSSFHYVKLFPIDYIKIEGEFVQNLLTENVDRAFVKSILTLAQELNIETVAEFVETKEIVDVLVDLGVDYAQGYYIDKPGPKIYKKGSIRDDL
jgi:diguanylate cyclase (GGDEF)-like protein